jgi:hypothetical protein
MAGDLGLLPVIPMRRVMRHKANAMRASEKVTTGTMRFLSMLASRMFEVLLGRKS